MAWLDQGTLWPSFILVWSSPSPSEPFLSLFDATMPVELMMGYRNDTFAEEDAVREAASGLESVEKLIRLLSHAQLQQLQQQSHATNSKSSMEIESDYGAVADVAVSKFKKVISLLGRTRTGHARFRRAPVPPPPPPPPPPSEPRFYRATPLQQIPPPTEHPFIPKNGPIETKDSSKTINFSYSNSFVSSLTGDTDTKQPSSSSPAAATPFQITNLSQVSSAGKPPISTSSLKRKCSSDNLGSAKCGSSSSRCHCSKKR